MHICATNCGGLPALRVDNLVYSIDLSAAGRWHHRPDVVWNLKLGEKQKNRLRSTCWPNSYLRDPLPTFGSEWRGAFGLLHAQLPQQLDHSICFSTGSRWPRRCAARLLPPRTAPRYRRRDSTLQLPRGSLATCDWLPSIKDRQVAPSAAHESAIPSRRDIAGYGCRRCCRQHTQSGSEWRSMDSRCSSHRSRLVRFPMALENKCMTKRVDNGIRCNISSLIVGTQCHN